MDGERYLTVEQAAERLQTHPQTVRKWLRTGRLVGTLISRRAGYRIAQTEVDRFLREGPREPEEKLAA
ncbi:MAG: helix-turn-helix domain-containing protein [Chloroflexota bacterium]|nr:helix-turn-helix domain-containing protein [Chloroflexota bacterium]